MIHEPGAVGANIDCDYHIGAQRTRVTDRNVRDQSAVNQETPVRVAHRNVQCRQAATGANCESEIAAVAEGDGSAGAQIGDHGRKWNFQIFETSHRQASAQKLFHARV